MSMERSGGIALAVGALAYIALMAVHPSHAGGHPIIGTFSLSGVVHATALVVQPILVFGFVVFTRHISFGRPLALLGLCFYVISAFFTMMAGTMSGLMFPFMVSAAHQPGADMESIRAFAQYTTWLNRSFAQVHFDLASLAILFWSIGLPAKSPLGWIARVAGVAVAVGVLGWHLSGAMNIEARQGALIVTLAQGAWTLLVAAMLLGQSVKPQEIKS